MGTSSQSPESAKIRPDKRPGPKASCQGLNPLPLMRGYDGLEPYPARIFIERFPATRQGIRREVPIRVSDGYGHDNLLVIRYLQDFS